MKRMILCLLCAGAILGAGEAVLAGGASSKPGLLVVERAYGPILPTGSVAGISAGFFDEGYAGQFELEHLGVDLSAPHGTDVVSPVYGTVLTVHIVSDPFQSYVVIEDRNSGWQHVVGHIDSDLKEGDVVAAGQVIGTVVTAGTGPHVHWGINRDVSGAISGSWGWGRAPLGSSEEGATARGWIDPLALL